MTGFRVPTSLDSGTFRQACLSRGCSAVGRRPFVPWTLLTGFVHARKQSLCRILQREGWIGHGGAEAAASLSHRPPRTPFRATRGKLRTVYGLSAERQDQIMACTVLYVSCSRPCPAAQSRQSSDIWPLSHADQDASQGVKLYEQLPGESFSFN